MNRLAVLILTLFMHTAYGQNLCPNPGFEQLSGCPAGAGEINLSPPWSDAGSPSDLFNFCHVNGPSPGCTDVGVPSNFAGNSSAHGGSSYAGFYTKKSTANQRTYIQVPLTSTLLSGQLYKITAFFKRSSFSKYATNRLGISFSTAPLSQTAGQFIPVTPQAELANVVADTGVWTGLTSYYTGTGLEDQLIIGNFRDDAATTSFNFSTPVLFCLAFSDAAFYYVDDVSVSKITEQLNVTGDTLICSGETTTLNGISNTQGWWSLLSAPADTIPAITNSITVNPAAATSYLWNGIQSTLTVTVQVTAPPLVSLPADTSVCDGISVTLNASNPSCTYLWSTGSTASQILATDSGRYVVTINNGSCLVTDTFLLGVLTSPDVYLGSAATICPDNDELITLDAGPGENYLWYPTGDTTATVTISEPGIYAVEVTHANGCSKSDTISVSEVCTETLFVPGAFTPNGDGKNDLFYADGTNILKFEMLIFNRWGQPVFTSETLGLAGAWNGKESQKMAPAGLYTYIINYDALKTNGKIKKESKSGYFILFK